MPACLSRTSSFDDMKWFRRTYWYASAFFQKRWKLISIVLVISAFATYLSLSVLLSPARLKPTRYIGRVGAITVASLPRDIQEQISLGLTVMQPDGTVKQGLAKSWSIEEDGKLYRFTLKDGVSWHDGRAVIPREIPLSFSDTKIIARDNEISFELKEPFAPFLSIVSQPVFRENQNSIIGAGSYRVLSITREGARVRELKLESVRDILFYRFYPTEDAAFTALKNGQIDELQDMTTDGGMMDWTTLRVKPIVRQDRYVGLFFNADDPFLDKAIRQALNYAIQKPTGEERAKTPIHPDSWAYNKTVKSYEQNLEKGVELLLKNMPRSPLTIELSTVPAFQADAERIKREWEVLGIEAGDACQSDKTIKNKSVCANLQIRVNLRITNVPSTNSFQVLLIGQQIPVDPDQYYLWHSTQSTNFTHYKNPRIDKLLEDGRKTMDPEERRSIYQDFQQYLVEDSIVIFLSHPTTYLLQRKQLL